MLYPMILQLTFAPTTPLSRSFFGTTVVVSSTLYVPGSTIVTL